MLTSEQFHHLATRLVAKTKAGQVLWRAGQEYRSTEGFYGRELEIEFPSALLTVGYFAPAGDPASDVDYVLFTISEKQGAVVDQRRIELGTDDWPLAVELCATAYSTVFGTKMLDEIFRLVDSNENIGSPSKSKEVFAMIKGKWHVTYPLQGKAGAEDVIIDGEGNYYLSNEPHRVYFRLADPDFDEASRQLRFTKLYGRGDNAGRHGTQRS